MTIKQTIGIKIASLSLLLLFFYSLQLLRLPKEWTIGVLALRGDAPQHKKHWLGQLIDTLDQQIPTDCAFLLLPLNLSEMKQAVAKTRVDFLFDESSAICPA